MPKVSVISLNHLLSEDIAKMAHKNLAQAMETADFDDAEWIYVNDSSTVKPIGLKDFDNYVEAQDMRSYSGAVNLGHALAKGELRVVISNDVTTPQGWLNELVQIMDKYPKIGKLGSSGPHSPKFWPDKNEFNEASADTCWEPLYITRKTVWEEVGSYDQNFVLYYQDNDWAYRVSLAGYMLANAGRIFSDHIGAATVKHMDFGDLGDGDKYRYLQKWGGSPGNERYRVPFNYPPKAPQDLHL